MKPFTKIASFIFALVAIGHLIRLIAHAQVMIGSHSAPMWISVLGLIVAAIISGGLWKEAKS